MTHNRIRAHAHIAYLDQTRTLEEGGRVSCCPPVTNNTLFAKATNNILYSIVCLDYVSNKREQTYVRQ